MDLSSLQTTDQYFKAFMTLPPGLRMKVETTDHKVGVVVCVGVTFVFIKFLPWINKEYCSTPSIGVSPKSIRVIGTHPVDYGTKSQTKIVSETETVIPEFGSVVKAVKEKKTKLKK